MRPGYNPEGHGHSQEHIAEVHAEIKNLQKKFTPAAEKILTAAIARRVPDNSTLRTIAKWWFKDKTDDLARNMATAWVDLGDNDHDRRTACQVFLSDTIRLHSSFEVVAARDFGLNHEERIEAFTAMLHAPQP